MSKNVQNMTEGKPGILIIRFMIPLLLGNLFQQTYNLVDAAIVGRTLGAGALAGVGASSSIQFLVMGLCIGSCAGFGIPIAQSFGARDHSDMRRYLYNACILAAVMAFVITAVTVFSSGTILKVLHTPDDIYKDAYTYLVVLFLGIPFTFLYNLTATVLRSVGNSRIPFVFLSVSTFLNIFLDMFCIVVLRMGVAGAAAATVASQLMSGVLCLIYIIRAVPVLHPKKEECVVEGRRLRILFMNGLPMGLQFSITATGSMFMQAANNSLGSVYVSAFTAATKIKLFMLCPMDAVGMAAATFVGQNYGAKKFDRVVQGIKDALLIAVLYALCSGLAMVLFGRQMASIFLTNGDPAILDAAAKYIGCLGALLFLLAFIYVNRSSVQALGFSKAAIFAGVLEMISRITVTSLMVPRFGFTAICWTDQTAWLSAASFCTILLYCLMIKLGIISGRKAGRKVD